MVFFWNRDWIIVRKLKQIPITMKQLLHSIISFLIVAIIFGLSLQSCTKDEDIIEPIETNNEDETTNSETDSDTDVFMVKELTGASQKGPYVVGTIVTILELEQDLTPTGRTFTTEINNNIGQFRFANLDLVSPFVELRSNGFYYNEVTGNTSDAPLSLSALVDLSDESTININILTTLEKDRVEYLITNGSSFTEAKSQAATEVLAVFYQEVSSSSNLDDLTITVDNDGNASLLAISSILQGYLSVGDLSALVSRIKFDLREDGLLDDESICISLASVASRLNANSVKSHLEEWYKDEQITVTIPDFSTQLEMFNQETPCAVASGITYPVDGRHGLNLLALETAVYDDFVGYSLAANLEEGSDLKIRIVGFHWSYSIGQMDTGWFVGDWEDRSEDLLDSGREFTSSRSGMLDFEINLEERIQGVNDGTIRIEIYENGSSVPTRVKEIKIDGIEPSLSGPRNLILQEQGSSNILGFDGSFTSSYLDEYQENYGIALWIPDGFEVKYIIEGDLVIPEVYGWDVFERTDGDNNIYELTANGYGYYEALFDYSCKIFHVESIVNGVRDSRLFNNVENSIYPKDGILDNDATLGEGIVSMDLEIYEDIIVTIKLTGEGWNVSSFLNNQGWEVGQYDSATSTQSFIADGNVGTAFYLELEIEPYVTLSLIHISEPTRPY